MAEAVGQGFEAVFSRPVLLADASQLTGRIEASEQERAALAQLMGIENLETFTFDYTLKPIAGDRFRLTGTLRAALTQACILTLEPVSERIDEAVSIECWPEEMMAARDQTEQTIDPADIGTEPPVAILNGKVDVGATAAEILASAIDPYPRKEGAEFDWNDPKDAGGEALSPFAQLAKLKSKG
jgi:hypothetical protein